MSETVAIIKLFFRSMVAQDCFCEYTTSAGAEDRALLRNNRYWDELEAKFLGLYVQLGALSVLSALFLLLGHRASYSCCFVIM
jgi:hypothetical protein